MHIMHIMHRPPSFSLSVHNVHDVHDFLRRAKIMHSTPHIPAVGVGVLDDPAVCSRAVQPTSRQVRPFASKTRVQYSQRWFPVSANHRPQLLQRRSGYSRRIHSRR